MDDALGIILAVHGKGYFGVPEGFSQLLFFVLNFRTQSGAVKPSEIDPHGKGADLDDAPVKQQLTELLFVPQDALHASEKVFSVILGVEADDIGSEQALDDFPPPLGRKQAIDFKLRERNMQEKSYADFR